MCVCCVAETRHTYPRLERKQAAIPEWDGKCYIIRVPDPAVHSLVPEPYLLRPGLARPLQGRPAGFRGFVCLIYFHGKAFFFFFFPAHCDWSLAFYAALLFLKIIIYMLVLALCLAHVIVLLLCCWPSSDFISCIDSSTQIWNVIEMFVTSVQTCVSLLNEQMENIVISIKRLPSLITPVQWKF